MPVLYRNPVKSQHQGGPASAAGNRNSNGFLQDYNIPPNNSSGNTGSLARNSALPRCTSHELALSVNNPHTYYPYQPQTQHPSNNYQSSVSTLPASAAAHSRQQQQQQQKYPSHSSLRRQDVAPTGSTSQPEAVATLSRGQRRVTFSNSSPASRCSRPPSVCVLPPEVGISLSPPASLKSGYGTASSSGGEASDAASTNSQTSGSYVINEKQTNAGGAAGRPAQTVSYIFV